MAPDASPLPDRTEVAVVGAGLAGLACAVRLAGAGLEVTVLERSDAPGGRVRTDVVDGYRLDRGFQLLNPYYPEARRVLDLTALDLQPFPSGVVVAGRGSRHLLADPRRTSPTRLPVAAWSGLTAPGGLGEKLALVRWGLGVQRASMDELLRRPDRAWGEVADRLGLTGPLRTGVLDTFLTGTLGEDAGAASRRFVELLVRAFLRGAPALPRRGMQAMPDQLAGRLPAGSLHYGVTAEQVTPESVGTAAGTLAARAVVVATDPLAAARLTGLPEPRTNALTTFWHLAEETPTRAGELHLDGDRRGPVLNTVVVTNAAPSYLPGSPRPDSRPTRGPALVASSTLGTATDQQTEHAVRDQVSRIFGCSTRGWQLLRADPIAQALPSMAPPFDPRRPVELPNGLFVAGDHRDTASIQGALVSGRRAADAVLARLGLPVPPRPALVG
jgi:phytoene dehydrogenase-like protein